MRAGAAEQTVSAALKFGDSAKKKRHQETKEPHAWNWSPFPKGIIGKTLYAKDQAEKIWNGLAELAREWGVADRLAADFAGMKDECKAGEFETAQCYYYRIQAGLLRESVARYGLGEEGKVA
jgi:hypothetical protein